jgi:nucleoid-associated protein YgaU
VKAVARLMFAVGLSAGLGLSSQGCSKPVLRIADASLGDYYTEKEYRKLHEEDRVAYCEELANQDSTYREEIAEARLATARHAARAAAARAAADSLERLADSLDAALAARVAAGGAQSPKTTRPGARPGTQPQAGTRAAAGTNGGERITVRPGDSLWRISARDSIYGDGRRWKALYEANRDRIRNADLIYPGQELNAPR